MRMRYRRDPEIEGDFYRAVAKALGVDYDYKPFPYLKKTRWNNRNPGNGRFIGRGLVRMFGPSAIHVNLHTPKLTGLFKSPAEALQAIVDSLAKM